MAVDGKDSGAVERLHFDSKDHGYHSYHAAQHLVRYSVLRNRVKGKVVLDLACGEGYGSRLLANWGAKEVYGVDVSEDAINVAKKLFKDPRCHFLVGEAETVNKLFRDLPKFDVVISLETIEHVKSPELFLAAVKKILKPRGIVVISCPNEEAFHGEEHPNQFHLRRYSFAQFKAVTERFLGKASCWLLGAPILGECNVPIRDDFSGKGSSDWRAILESDSVHNCLRIPASQNLLLTPKTSSHYLGVWGVNVESNVVFSTQSAKSVIEPYKAVEWYRGQSQLLEERLARQAEEIIPKGLLAREKEVLETEIDRLKTEVQYLRSKVFSFAKQIELNNEPAVRKIREWYEPRLQRLEKREKKHENRLVVPIPSVVERTYKRVKKFIRSF
jgi:2-polyprenyl-3-methyl-5-hydroxy-6-metoxy-1,4-benzoquinol methylase